MGSELGIRTSKIATRAVSNVAHPAAIIDSDHTILEANRPYAALFGKGGVTVVGRRCFEVSHGRSRPCAEMGERCPLDTALGSHRAVEAVHTHYTSRGKALETVHIDPIEAKDGVIRSFLEVLYPVDDQRDRGRFIGRAPAIRRMWELIDRVARAEIPVLLQGESGTGKELVAHAIHQGSHRATRNFVPVDCSGLAETLFESELFGHEQGAFTGATHPKKGLVEAAQGGTLFLDEIGDVPLSQQVKLLRLLESGFYRRVGAVDLRKSDFRLICATHRNLREMVKEGSFRRDLYHRIDAFPIETPPLRTRMEDLGLIANDLLLRIDPHKPRTLAPQTVRLLEQHGFPGNVRELLNLLQRACLLADDGAILPEHLPEELLAGAVPAQPPLWGMELGEEILPLDQVEHYYLKWVTANFQGERRELARRLGISERSLYRKLSACGSTLFTRPASVVSEWIESVHQWYHVSFATIHQWYHLTLETTHQWYHVVVP